MVGVAGEAIALQVCCRDVYPSVYYNCLIGLGAHESKCMLSLLSVCCGAMMILSGIPSFPSDAIPFFLLGWVVLLIIFDRIVMIEI
jgi:hypothetical protein